MFNPDIYLFHLINNLAGRIPALDTLGIFAAVFLLPLLAFLLVPMAFTVKRLREEHWWELPVKALIAAALGYGLRTVVGVVVARPRPFAALADVQPLISVEHLANSFPSGHATLAFALAFMVFKKDRDWGLAFLILALLIGLGRVFVGVHYPLDIVGGAMMGWLAAVMVQWVERREWRKIERALRVR